MITERGGKTSEVSQEEHKEKLRKFVHCGWSKSYGSSFLNSTILGCYFVRRDIYPVPKGTDLPGFMARDM